MENEQTVYVALEDIRAARMGFFRHKGLGKLVRVTSTEQPEGIVIEVCTSEHLSKLRVKSGEVHTRWPKDPENYERIQELVSSHKDYSERKDHQSFTFTSEPECRYKSI